MLKELFKPNEYKIILSIPFVIFFWFFPIISKSIIAIPFINFSSSALSLILNLIIAYFFSCLIIENLKDRKKIILIIFIILLTYFLIPKISSYDIGDLGGTTEKYCDCNGIAWYQSECCGSSVNYCIGLCERNESTTKWPKYIS